MKAQRLCLDKINTLPPSIIESILCRVPIEEAVRTSILSKEWRYKWTKIPELMFVEDELNENQLSVLEQTFEKPSERKEMSTRCKFFYAIYQVLLLHEGPILQFSLYMKADETCVEIDHIILHLSRNCSVKKLFLSFSYSSKCKLPSAIFSLHQITNLHLHMCHLDHQPTFSGFGNLTSLFMRCVETSKKTLLHLLSNSPLLKDVALLLDEESIICNDKSTITELFECLPLIEDLCMLYGVIECFAQEGVPLVLQTPLIHLRDFFLGNVCIIDTHWLPFVCFVIRSSPNLEILKLAIFHDQDLEKSEIESEIKSVTLENCMDIWLDHLSEFEMEDFTNLKPYLEFVKLILAKAPVLKKLIIVLDYEIAEDEEMLILKLLSSSPRASPLVEITVRRHSEEEINGVQC